MPTRFVGCRTGCRPIPTTCCHHRDFMVPHDLSDSLLSVSANRIGNEVPAQPGHHYKTPPAADTPADRDAPAGPHLDTGPAVEHHDDHRSRRRDPQRDALPRYRCEHRAPDAQLLALNLIDAAQGRRELLAAIRDYETRMIDYGFAAVRLSLRTAEQTISNNRLGRSMVKTALRLFALVPSLIRKAFADLGSD